MAVDVVDAQVHRTRTMTADRIVASMDALGIASVMIDEWWGLTDRGPEPCALLEGGAYRPLSPYAQAAALEYPERCSYLQRVERRDSQLAALIPVLASSPGCRALRVVLIGRTEREAFGSGEWDEVLALAQDHQLPVCVLGPDVATVPAVARRFGGLQLILDHCGWCRSVEHWDGILALGSVENVSMKWSHAARAFPPTETQRQFERAVDAFGVQRLLWASDITEDESGSSWSELMSFIADNSALSAGDREWVLGRTARQVFRLPVPAAPSHPTNEGAA